MTITVTIPINITTLSMNNFAEFSELASSTIIDITDYVRSHIAFINGKVPPFLSVILPDIHKSTCIM